MKLIQVESSNIEAIGFEEDFAVSLNRKKVSRLRVKFSSGFVYDYYDVDESVFKEFLESDSKGKFFHSNIKDKYLFEKVGE